MRERIRLYRLQWCRSLVRVKRHSRLELRHDWKRHARLSFRFGLFRRKGNIRRGHLRGLVANVQRHFDIQHARMRNYGISRTLGN